jgi:hypothetical protein
MKDVTSLLGTRCKELKIINSILEDLGRCKHIYPDNLRYFSTFLDSNSSSILRGSYSSYYVS